MEDTHKHQEIRDEQQPLAAATKETHRQMFSVIFKSQFSLDSKLRGY